MMETWSVRWSRHFFGGRQGGRPTRAKCTWTTRNDMYLLGQCGGFWRGKIKIYLEAIADLVDTALAAPIGLLLPG